MDSRHTSIAHGRHAIRQLHLDSARHGRHGQQVMTFERIAARLAGGFVKVIDDDILRDAVQAALPTTRLLELEGIKLLPGMVGAATDTLHKAWRAGIDLQARAGDHPRLAALATLEKAVLEHLPKSVLRPCDAVSAALARIHHAPVLFGPLQISGMTELWPCWRPLLLALTRHVPVEWIAGPRQAPDWLERSGVDIRRSDRQRPAVEAVSAATAYHEAIEAMRWARSLLASGVAPLDIAIAAVTPTDYDGHFLALRADANLDLHFVHGIGVLGTRDGQGAAALADILLRGLSQGRVRRLSTLLHSAGGLFASLQDGWTRILPTDAPLASTEAWVRLLDRTPADKWPDGNDQGGRLLNIIELLQKGLEAADEIGEALLAKRSLTVWRKALAAGPAGSLDLTLEKLRIDDGLEGCASVCWMPASDLAATPRKYVRLLGLNSSRWPRGISEDRLLSDHIVPTAELDPLPAGAADRRDFATILATTEGQVVLSRARRDSDGRLLGRSTLLEPFDEKPVRRNQVPQSAFSETDRLMARGDEFRATAQAISAGSCWRDWHSADLTPHDGLVRPDHPVLLEILNRTHSASSLRQLLRNPLGFVWHYGLKWRAPETGIEPLTLNPIEMGELIHAVLDRTLQELERSGGLAGAKQDKIAAAVTLAVEQIDEDWRAERPIPPVIIWRRTLEEVSDLSRCALAFGGEPHPGLRSFSEVPFGGSERKSSASLPWDSRSAVTVPGTAIRIGGYIDRLDISGDSRHAFVADYKTGRVPKKPFVLQGGSELQRCLYAFAVKALLGSDISVNASLVYPRGEMDFPLLEPEATLEKLIDFLNVAVTSLAAGRGLLGPDGGGTYDDLAFAMPANAGATYRVRKGPAILECLGDATAIWEEE